MSKNSILFIGLLLLAFGVNGQKIDDFQELLSTVEGSKAHFRQSLKKQDGNMFQYIIVEVDHKGNETEVIYKFSFSDIDENTVRSITKKDLIIVQLLVRGKQKLIQVITNGGDKISYTDQIHFLATDSNNGDQLSNTVKGIIPKAVAFDESRLSLNGYGDHMKWLLEHISDVELPKKQIVQKLSYDHNVAGKITLEQTFNVKNKSESQLRELNLFTLNPNSVGYRISGDEFVISAETRRDINGIKYVEDDEQKYYQNQLRIYAKSVSNGKDIYNVLKASIPLAQAKFNENQTNFSKEIDALNFLNKAIQEVSTSKESLTQNLRITKNNAQLICTETAPDKSTELVYTFNFADINPNTIDYDGQKDRLFVKLTTKKSLDFIQFKENGELQNYVHDTKIFFSTIENAITGVEALKFLATSYESRMDKNSYLASTVPKAIADLKPLLSQVSIDEDNFNHFLELTDDDTRTIKITTVFSNLKKSVEITQEFSLAEINPKNCGITVKGKHVFAELNTKHLEKVVKTYVDGQIKPYQYKVSIEAIGIEEARQIVGIVQSITEKLK
ncbi:MULTISPECIES: hypothetical protein [Flavobacteriaceae]|uniref:hypothetical protein n=1 Tax=Flavobacteriaceae TaxID=49546 RepID=UPI001490C4FE|nr:MULTISPECIES: hypothetical protein [Allomuricauda]MDC6366662.1 hypothetical protein [Muricauda sp. AC10]